eukprot:13642859-Alexandrium_andersonii.AAC.1
MGRSLNPRWESGVWLGRRRGAASRIAAVSPTQVREVRAAARRPLPERWGREELQNLRAVPWAWRAGPECSDGGPPQVIPHVAQDAPVPPPRARAAPAPMR